MEYVTLIWSKYVLHSGFDLFLFPPLHILISLLPCSPLFPSISSPFSILSHFIFRHVPPSPSPLTQLPPSPPPFPFRVMVQLLVWSYGSGLALICSALLACHVWSPLSPRGVLLSLLLPTAISTLIPALLWRCVSVT